MSTDLAEPRATATSSLEERLVPQVGDLIVEYVAPLEESDERAYQEELEAIEPAQASAAARLHTLFAG